MPNGSKIVEFRNSQETTRRVFSWTRKRRSCAKRRPRKGRTRFRCRASSTHTKCRRKTWTAASGSWRTLGRPVWIPCLVSILFSLPILFQCELPDQSELAIAQDITFWLPNTSSASPSETASRDRGRAGLLRETPCLSLIDPDCASPVVFLLSSQVVGQSTSRLLRYHMYAWLDRKFTVFYTCEICTYRHVRTYKLVSVSIYDSKFQRALNKPKHLKQNGSSVAKMVLLVFIGGNIPFPQVLSVNYPKMWS